MNIKVAAFSVSKKSIYIGCMQHFQCRLQITYDLREGNRNGFRQHNTFTEHTEFNYWSPLKLFEYDQEMPQTNMPTRLFMALNDRDTRN